MTKNPFDPVQIYFEHNGKQTSGFYRVEGAVVSVQYRGLIKHTQIGNSPPETLARMMISEMIREENQNQS